MNKVLLFFLAMIFSFGTVNGQNALSKEVKVDALNSVLHFVNEGAHGMLIVHRMLENYNQDINKYADLESFKINFYTNKDLPKDIFEDLEKFITSTYYVESSNIIEYMHVMSTNSQIQNLRATKGFILTRHKMD